MITLALLQAYPATLGCALLVALLAPTQVRRYVAGLALAAMSLLAVGAGMGAAYGTRASLNIPGSWLDACGTVVKIQIGLAPDAFGGIFAVLAGVVGVAASIYAIGYVHGAADSRGSWAALVLFVGGMQLVPLAGDMISFLGAWELMAIASTVLVATEHTHRPTVRRAVLWYATMTHLSFLLIALGFAVLAVNTHLLDFNRLTGTAPSTLVIGLLLAGFAIKAGLVPGNVWLPMAHPQAPSHVSALMSAVMVKMGCYGMLMVCCRLMPGLAWWWGVILLAVGAISALAGILLASVSSHFKQLLAYSTTENVGLITVALGLAVVLRPSSPELAAGAVAISIVLCLSHALFKSTLFLSAGAIMTATGRIDLDQLGGLARRMPVTAVCCAAGAAGAAALPGGVGFIAEWLLLQQLVHAHAPGLVGRFGIPIATAVVALTAGLALLTFVKAFGAAFLARPRSVEAENAVDVNGWMKLGQGLLALCVVGVGLVPGIAVWLGNYATKQTSIELGPLLGLRMPFAHAQLSPLALAALLAVVALPVAVITLVARRRAPRVAAELPWACGQSMPSPRMQYTATSYAEPLVRVFDDALQPDRELSLPTDAPVRGEATKVRFVQELHDVLTERLYQPAVRALLWLSDQARRVHNGSVQRYLSFSFVALLCLLVVVTW